MVPDYDDPYNELIVHMPLEQEGQWLQIGKEVLNKKDEIETFIHKMIHIPLDQVLFYQWHNCIEVIMEDLETHDFIVKFQQKNVIKELICI